MRPHPPPAEPPARAPSRAREPSGPARPLPRLAHPPPAPGRSPAAAAAARAPPPGHPAPTPRSEGLASASSAPLDPLLVSASPSGPSEPLHPPRQLPFPARRLPLPFPPAGAPPRLPPPSPAAGSPAPPPAGLSPAGSSAPDPLPLPPLSASFPAPGSPAGLPAGPDPGRAASRAPPLSIPPRRVPARLGASCVPAILSRRAFDSCRPGGVCPLPPSGRRGRGRRGPGVGGRPGQLRLRPRGHPPGARGRLEVSQGQPRGSGRGPPCWEVQGWSRAERGKPGFRGVPRGFRQGEVGPRRPVPGGAGAARAGARVGEWLAGGAAGSPTALGSLLAHTTLCLPSPAPPAHPHSPKVSSTLHCFPSPWQRCRSWAWCGGEGPDQTFWFPVLG